MFCIIFAPMRAVARLVICFLFAATLLFPLSPSAQEEEFMDGCCVNSHAFPRPTHVSERTVSGQRLWEALNCAANNQFIGGLPDFAKSMGDTHVLRVAYYYGHYMEEEDKDADPPLVLAVYSANGKDGFLFDSVWDKHDYFIDNLPNLKRATKRWRVGEINGGLWSYSRLYYLAQEIGSRPRQLISVRTIKAHPPSHCYVMNLKQEISSFAKH
jgi:hypothetical protein